MILSLVLPAFLSCPVASPGVPTLDDDEPRTEFQVLAAARKAMAQGSREEKIDALRAVAQLGLADPRRPSPKIARELAGYLDDGEAATRVEAARLSLGQDPATALSELGKRVEAAAKLLRRFMAETDRWKNTSKVVYLARFPQFESVRELGDYPVVVEAMIDALGSMPDDRAVEAILSVLEMPTECASASLLVASVEALLKLESRAAIDGVAAAIAELRASFEAEDTPVDRKGRPIRQKREKDPRFGRLSRLRPFSDRYPPIGPRTLGTIVARVHAWAKQRKLEAPAKDAEAAAWKAWAKEIRGEFPARLEGLK